MLYLLFVFTAFLPAPTQTPDTPKNTLTVEVHNVLTRKGAVYIALFKPNGEFPEGTPMEGKRVVVSGGSVKATFQVEPGSYAVAVFHDENSNSKMDKNLFGMPKEPYGMSNNFRPKFSAPKFSDCQFTVGNESKEIRISVK